MTLVWWWLSFCDVDKPKGQQFLGGCVVQAPSLAAAISEAHRLGCNPGGEVEGFAVPEKFTANVGGEGFPPNKLLSKKAITQLERKLGG